MLQNVRYPKYVGYTEPLRLGSEGIGSISRIKWVMIPSEDDPNIFGYSKPNPSFLLTVLTNNEKAIRSWYQAGP